MCILYGALGLRVYGYICARSAPQAWVLQSLNITTVAVEHQGSSFDVPLVPMSPSFVDHVLGIVNADRIVRVVQAPGDDVEGVTKLRGPLGSPPSTQVEVATPTPLEGKEASAEQSVESCGLGVGLDCSSSLAKAWALI